MTTPDAQPNAAVDARSAAGPPASGLALGLTAYLCWGAMPLYFLAMRPAGAFEIVAWRIVFSVLFCALLVTVTRAGRALRTLLRSRRTVALLGLAGVLIYANWQIYVYATTVGRVADAALGYFITPIVSILLGVVVLRERLRPGQWIAVGISVIAIVVLTVEAGTLPWISLGLAASFGAYGLVKKRVSSTVDALSGLTIETAWLAPVAIVQLLVVGSTTGLAFGNAGLAPTLVLASAGIGTAIPLLLFAGATQRLPLTIIGFLQYLSPILQLLVGVVLLGEAMPLPRLIGFAIVWLALAVVIVEGLIAGGRRRSRNSVDRDTTLVPVTNR